MSKFDERTELIHAGSVKADPASAVTVPVYFSSTFKQPHFEGGAPYGYARGSNPTREALENLIAQLEGGKHAFAFASGMAATQAALSLLEAGDRVLVSRNIYGGTYDLLQHVFSRFGVSFSLAHTADIAALEAEITPDVKAVFVESPSNPTLEVTDLRKVAALAKKHGILSIVDNTFMSPYLQRPLDFGIDVVVESATKYLGGHSDLIGGVLAVKDDALAERVHRIQALVGGIMQPFDAFLLTRGIRTLSVRVDRQVENAVAIAEFLKKHPAVKTLHYPGLADDPGYAVQKSQAKNGGAMLSFELDEKYDIKTFFEALEIFTNGASLGGVEALIGHPATTSHRGIPAEIREKVGITDRLVRVSPGIEYAGDLINDLAQALQKAEPKA